MEIDHRKRLLPLLLSNSLATSDQPLSKLFTTISSIIIHTHKKGNKMKLKSKYEKKGEQRWKSIMGRDRCLPLLL